MLQTLFRVDTISENSEYVVEYSPRNEVVLVMLWAYDMRLHRQ